MVTFLANLDFMEKEKVKYNTKINEKLSNLDEIYYVVKKNYTRCKNPDDVRKSHSVYKGYLVDDIITSSILWQ